MEKWVSFLKSQRNWKKSKLSKKKQQFYCITAMLYNEKIEKKNFEMIDLRYSYEINNFSNKLGLIFKNFCLIR